MFSSSSFVCFAAISSASSPASGILQGLISIYERRGLRGFYNGMGASFVRAVPCALINYTLTRKFENVFSSMESWGLAEMRFSLPAVNLTLNNMFQGRYQEHGLLLLWTEWKWLDSENTAKVKSPRCELSFYTAFNASAAFFSQVNVFPSH